LGLSIIGVLLFGLSFTDVARMHVQFAIDQNLVFTLRFLAILFLVLGFRGNYPSLKAIHKTVAVFMGIIPTMYLFMATVVVFVVSLMTWFLSMLSGSLETDLLNGVFAGVVFWILSASITVGVWLVIVRGVFAQYKYPYDLDRQSKMASVAVLLVFFGGFGVHRFFVGRIPSGILYFMTMGLLGIGVIVDGVMLMLGRFKDVDGNTV